MGSPAQAGGLGRLRRAERAITSRRPTCEQRFPIFWKLKQVFHAAMKRLRQPQRHRGRRTRASGFDLAQRLPADPRERGKFSLRDASLVPHALERVGRFWNGHSGDMSSKGDKCQACLTTSANHKTSSRHFLLRSLRRVSAKSFPSEDQREDERSTNHGRSDLRGCADQQHRRLHRGSRAGSLHSPVDAVWRRPRWTSASLGATQRAQRLGF